jgi:putative PIN family toxin of toxin-antitoxin system
VIVAVLDTNVLASGIAGISRAQSTPGELLRRWRGNTFTLVVSQPILDELNRTLTNPYFAARLSPAEVEDSLLRLRAETRLQPLTVRVSGRATHPQDDLILATTLSAKANYLVTGDHELLAMGAFQGARIVTPREFLALLASDSDEQR